MALVRITVNVLGYEPGDEVDDLPKEWEDRLIRAEYAERVTKKDADPEAKVGLTDEAKETVNPKK